MMTTRHTAFFMGLSFLAAGTVTTAALAETKTFDAELTGTQEVPPTTSKGTGAAFLTLDTASKQLKYSVTYTGLTGPATAAHIHGPAEAGKNAGVLIPFASAASKIEGTATLTDVQAADLAAGKMYINVHTAENKNGEIRGQVKPAQ